MKTITLRYDERDPQALKAIKTLFATGAIKIKKLSLGAWRTRRAIRAVERGKVVTCDSFEGFKQRMRNV